MNRRTALGLFLLSVATLLFEITLTRLFSVAQFYHFAFMIISLAMLGFGASGTLLALFPGISRWPSSRTLSVLTLGFGLTSAGAYVLMNVLPFDSFSIAWDPRQVWILLLHYLVLSLPFFCSGAVLSLLFLLYPQGVGRCYALNLAGSAVGCVLALWIPTVFGGTASVWLSAMLAGVAILCFVSPFARGLRWGLVAVGLIMVAVLMLLFKPPFARLQLSPYKALRYALQFPESRIIWQQWNGFSRVDVVESAGIRSLPGLSYRYLEPPPPQHGLLVDADDLTPILKLSPSVLTLSSPVTSPPVLRFTDFLPTSLAYQLRPDGQALILAPGGGLEIWTALAQGAAYVTAVEANPLIHQAVGELYTASPVSAVAAAPRSFVRRTAANYDVVTLALTTPYHPIRSGAYSLAENYHYTVEAFGDALMRLEPEGIFVVSRWLQTPPSESLRTFSLVVTALASMQDPTVSDEDWAPQRVVAFRGYAMMTFLVKRVPFTDAELARIRDFTQVRAFDLVYAPDLQPDELNRYNVLEEPVYARLFRDLLESEDRQAWYAAYAFDVTPPTDNHPFFGHFFKWSQASQIWADFGKQWQPFGGAGYFVLLALLALAVVAAAVVILLPVLTMSRARGGHGVLFELLYFGLLGVAYLFVEIPLMQQFILFLGHPAYAMTAVLFAILLFSGVGSLYSHRLPVRWVLLLLVGGVLLYAPGLRQLFAATLALPLGGRVLVAMLALAPVGVLMGMPFPQGLRRLETRAPSYVPWAWGINGALSVVASVLAALLSLSFGFNLVLICGALCYAAAGGVLFMAGGFPPQ